MCEACDEITLPVKIARYFQFPAEEFWIIYYIFLFLNIKLYYTACLIEKAYFLFTSRSLAFCFP